MRRTTEIAPAGIPWPPLRVGGPSLLCDHHELDRLYARREDKYELSERRRAPDRERGARDIIAIVERGLRFGEMILPAPS